MIGRLAGQESAKTIQPDFGVRVERFTARAWSLVLGASLVIAV
jgi:hypothetical protein